jgi:hypothetical protein
MYGCLRIAGDHACQRIVAETWKVLAFEASRQKGRAFTVGRASAL